MRLDGRTYAEASPHLILSPFEWTIAKRYMLPGRAQVTDWKTINASLFEALAVERVAMFVVLSIIVLVAVFNILSSLIMLVRAKTRDIAILRTMGATRKSLLKVFVTIGFIIGALGRRWACSKAGLRARSRLPGSRQVHSLLMHARRCAAITWASSTSSTTCSPISMRPRTSFCRN